MNVNVFFYDAFIDPNLVHKVYPNADMIGVVKLDKKYGIFFDTTTRPTKQIDQKTGLMNLGIDNPHQGEVHGTLWSIPSSSLTKKILKKNEFLFRIKCKFVRSIMNKSKETITKEKSIIDEEDKKAKIESRKPVYPDNKMKVQDSYDAVTYVIGVNVTTRINYIPSEIYMKTILKLMKDLGFPNTYISYFISKCRPKIIPIVEGMMTNKLDSI